MRQRIAIDIDEVLAQHNQGLAEWHNKKFGTNHTADSYFTDYWSKVWRVSSEEAEKRAIAFHSSKAHTYLKPVANAYEALLKLKQSYDLSVITVRRQSTVDDTYEWIARHFPSVFDDIHFVHFWDSAETTTKAQTCQKIGARYLIDDSIKHCILAEQAGIQAILFGNYSWNRDVLPTKNIQRANDWSQVLRILDAT